MSRDLPPSLQQGVGFGIYKYMGGGGGGGGGGVKVFPLHCYIVCHGVLACKPGGGLVKLVANQGVGRGWER